MSMKGTKSDIKIKRLKKDDHSSFKELVALFNDVFENENKTVPKKGYLRKILENPYFIAFVAIDKHKVVGGLTGFILPKYYAKESEIFIYDIAINPKHQRKGIGKSLLSELKKYAKTKGISEIFVAANKEDKHAIDFYLSTKGKAEEVVHFNYGIKQ